MKKVQIEMCNQKITELIKIISKNYERIEYLEKFIDKSYKEEEYDSFSDYEIDISEMEKEINFQQFEIERNTELLDWIKNLKNL
jgi:hypothetical protein